ncbi:MAG: GNAT family N-acetyltransferase [Mycobacterium leprae]
MSDAFEIAPPASDMDREWLAALWQEEWGGELMVTKGSTYRLQDLQALLAFAAGTPVGAATYRLDGRECELMSINARLGGQGIGTRLLAAVEACAREAGAHRVWLITSNDNLDALRFYQRRGYRLTAVHPNAIDEARRLKPTIPTVGDHGIPLHDELELAKEL